MCDIHELVLESYLTYKIDPGTTLRQALVTLRWGAVIVEHGYQDISVLPLDEAMIGCREDTFELWIEYKRRAYAYCFVFDTYDQLRDWREAAKLSKKNGWTTKYKLGKKFDSGGNGVVYHCNNRETNTKAVVKVVPRDDWYYHKRECEFMCELNHPNIMKAYDIFITMNDVLFFMPYMNQHSIYRTIRKQKENNTSSDREYNLKSLDFARMCMLQVLNGVKFLHENRIFHQDLKPGNIFVQEDEEDNLILKIGDFGAATRIPYGGSLPSNNFEKWTTENYESYEQIWERSFGIQADMWSAGCTLFYLVTGDELIKNRTKRSIQQAIKQGFTKELADKVTDTLARDLIAKMLITIPSERITASEALEHPFFTEHTKYLWVQARLKKSWFRVRRVFDKCVDVSRQFRHRFLRIVSYPFPCLGRNVYQIEEEYF